MAVVSGPQRRSRKDSTKGEKCVRCPKESRPKVGEKEGDRERTTLLRKGEKLKNSWHRLPWPLSTRSRDDVPPIHRATLRPHFSSYLFSIRFSNQWIFIISSPDQNVSGKRLACVYARAWWRKKESRGENGENGENTVDSHARRGLNIFHRRQQLMYVLYLTISVAEYFCIAFEIQRILRVFNILIHFSSVIPMLRITMLNFSLFFISFFPLSPLPLSLSLSIYLSICLSLVFLRFFAMEIIQNTARVWKRFRWISFCNERTASIVLFPLSLSLSLSLSQY